MPNPKYLDNIDLVDLIYQKAPALYERLVRGDKIMADRKRLINIYKEVYCGR
jgi:hypothetical protein